MITRHLLDAAELPADEGQGGAVTLIQRLGSVGKLDIHLHCLVLDGVYRCGADGAPTFVGGRIRLLASGRGSTAAPSNSA